MQKSPTIYIAEKRFYRAEITEREIAGVANHSNGDLSNEPEIETEEEKILVLACAFKEASSRISPPDALENCIFTTHRRDWLPKDERRAQADC